MEIQKILTNHSKTAQSLKEDIEKIKKWMKTQPQLPEILSDNYIRNFLVLRKFDLNKVKESIENYYIMRNELPEFFKQNFSVNQLNEMVHWVMLPKKTQELYTVYLFQFNNIKLAEQLNIMDLMSYVLSLIEIRLSEEVMVGDIAIFNVKDVSLSFLSKITPNIITNCIKLYSEIFGMPVKGVYVINAPPYVTSFVTVIKALLKPKLSQRVKIFQDEAPLKEIFPHEMLPKDYGGTEKSVAELVELQELKLLEYAERFEKLKELRYDEGLKKIKDDGVFGVCGDFRKIEID